MRGDRSTRAEGKLPGSRVQREEEDGPREIGGSANGEPSAASPGAMIAEAARRKPPAGERGCVRLVATATTPATRITPFAAAPAGWGKSETSGGAANATNITISRRISVAEGLEMERATVVRQSSQTRLREPAGRTTERAHRLHTSAMGGVGFVVAMVLVSRMPGR